MSTTVWAHCSPALISTGLDCDRTKRRPCACPSGGSHDHVVTADDLLRALAWEQNHSHELARQIGDLIRVTP